MRSSTQLVVIGAGPGGYAAAFYAADRGMKVTLVDPEKNPGGVCVYRGCIPSKALLHVADVITESAHAADFGVAFEKPKIDLDKLRDFKNKVVGQLTSGAGQVRNLRKIQHLQGMASFRDARTLDIDKVDGTKETLTFEHCIIATGSVPTTIPGLSIDSPRLMDSTGALDLPDVPEVAARRRRRLHRPGAGQRLRRARQQGHRRRDDRRACCPAPIAISSTSWPSGSSRSAKRSG